MIYRTLFETLKQLRKIEIEWNISAAGMGWLGYVNGPPKHNITKKSAKDMLDLIRVFGLVMNPGKNNWVFKSCHHGVEQNHDIKKSVKSFEKIKYC
jgi:hypothetical protein